MIIHKDSEEQRGTAIARGSESATEKEGAKEIIVTE